jgi:C-terminal processing protease CtpA/Prc
MRVGDKITEFNGKRIDGMPQEMILNMISKADNVTLQLEKHGATLHGVRDLILDH